MNTVSMKQAYLPPGNRGAENTNDVRSEKFPSDIGVRGRVSAGSLDAGSAISTAGGPESWVTVLSAPRWRHKEKNISQAAQKDSTSLK